MDKDKQLQQEERHLSELKRLINEYAGIAFGTERPNSTEHLLKSYLASETELPLAELCFKVRHNTEFRKKLAERLLIHETYFYREIDPLNLVVERLSSDFHSADTKLFDKDRVLRAWSAGCSTGEEAYTLAMLLSQSSLGRQFRIIGSDLSETAINIARAGTYSKWSLRGIDDSTTETYFLQNGQNFHFNNHELKSLIEFRKGNLLDQKSLDVNWHPVHLILCRNVLIYFDKENIAKVAQIFFKALAPGGYLLTGASDPLLHEYAEFETVQTPFGLIYRRPLHATKVMTHRQTNENHDLQNSLKQLSNSSQSATRLPERATEIEIALLAQAETKYKAGKWQEVVDLLSPFPDVEVEKLTKALLNLGRADEVVKIAHDCIKFQPTKVDAYIMLALAFISLKKFHDANQSLNKAIFLERALPFAHFLKGIAYFSNNNLQEASKSLKRAIDGLANLDDDAIIAFSDRQTKKQLLRDISRYTNIIESKSQLKGR